MTRKWFLSLIGLGAAGQTTKTEPYKPPKPNNGTCPVCGFLVEPYTLQSGERMYYDAQLDAWIDLSFSAHYRTRMISCSHCRVMFQQDAERTP